TMRVCRLLAYFISTASLALAACSSSPDDDAFAVADDAIKGAPQTFQEGDELVTTANLNLRDQPSLRGNVLTVMPRGSSVTVASPDDGVNPGALDDTGDDTTGPVGNDGSGDPLGGDDAGVCVDHQGSCLIGEDTCCDENDVCGDDPDFPGATVCATLLTHRAPSSPAP